MTKRERLEDLGKLALMLRDILDNEIFLYTDTKHEFDKWVEVNHDKEEDGFKRGMQHIFTKVRELHMAIENCWLLADGDDE